MNLSKKKHLDYLLLHLALIKSIGPATVEKLVAALSLDAVLQLYTMNVADLKALARLPESTAQQLWLGLADRKLLEQELELLQRHSILWVTVYDSAYPALLKQSYLPPIVLYFMGLPLAAYDRSIAFVGSRSADRYGHSAVQQLIPELISHNWAIVSGGALGIDTMAHQATLDAKGATVVILGSGLLHLYPGSNSKLFKRVVEEGGTLVSSYGLTTAPAPGNFPARNRIIAGLSKACIIVQAAQQSGALITARYALEQGKEVGAVPGPITNPLSAGCHKLISEGAAIITNAQDILQLVNDNGTVFRPTGADLQPKTLQAQLHSIQTEDVPKQLPSVQKNILTLAQLPISIDELLTKMVINPEQLQEELFTLQLEGLIDQNVMGLWQSVI